LGGKITKEAKEAKILHRTLPITEAKYHVKYLLESYAKLRLKGETFENGEERYLSRNTPFQAIAFYSQIQLLL